MSALKKEYPRQDRLVDLKRKIESTQANLDWLQSTNSCNMPRSKEQVSRNDDSFKIPDKLPKLSVKEMLAEAKSRSDLSASNNI